MQRMALDFTIADSSEGIPLLFGTHVRPATPEEAQLWALLEEVRSVWADGYMPPIPGEGAVLRQRAIDRLNELLTRSATEGADDA